MGKETAQIFAVKWLLKATSTAVFLIFIASSLRAQPQSPASSAGYPDQDLDLEVPASFVGDTYLPYNRLLNVDGSFYRPRSYSMDPTPRFGPGRLQLPSLGFNLDALSNIFDIRTHLDILDMDGFAPEEAKLRLGMFYFDVESATFSMLFSDNVDLDHDDREAGIIGIMSLNDMRIMLRTEKLRLSISGNFIVLPFEGEAGFTGFGIRKDLLQLGLYGTGDAGTGTTAWLEGLRGEIAFDFRAAGWNVDVVDTFGAEDFYVYQDFGAYLFDELGSLEAGPVLDGRGTDFDEEDRTGRYVTGERGLDDVGGYPDVLPGTDQDLDLPRSLGMGGPTPDFDSDLRGDEGIGSYDARRFMSSRRRRGRTDIEERFQREVDLDFRNTFSVRATRDPVAQVRPEVVVFRQDRDYVNVDSEDDEPRAAWREGVSFALITERESMRFPPYAQYTMSHDSDNLNWRRVLRLGIGGPAPITENMTVSGSVGYATDTEDESAMLYALTLIHQPRRYTSHSLGLYRYFSEPEDELRKLAIYRLYQVLGPHLSAQFVAGWTKTDDEEADVVQEEKWGSGGSLLFASPSRKLLSSIGLMYTEENGEVDQEDWEIALDVSYQFTDQVELYYQRVWDTDGDEYGSVFEVNYQLQLLRRLLLGDLRLRYRFLWTDSNIEENKFYENLLILSYTRYF